MRKACLLAPFLLVSALAMAAPSLSVSYIEGSAYQKSGATWAELSIGDQVATDASVRLDSGAELQLKGSGANIFLTQAGTYSVQSLLSMGQKISSAGVGKALSNSLAYLLNGPASNSNAVLGARGADESKSTDSDWVESGTQEAIQQAKDFIQSQKYDEAVRKLTQTLDEATPEESPEVHYYLAYAYSLNGDSPNAVRQLSGVKPGTGVSWLGDYTLLKARLLLDGNAFAQAVQLLTQPTNDLSGDAQRAPLYHFLLGMAYRGLGDTSNEKVNLAKVVTISKDTDLGKAAAQLLENP
jgi:hypothetical protein